MCLWLIITPLHLTVEQRARCLYISALRFSFLFISLYTCTYVYEIFESKQNPNWWIVRRGVFKVNETWQISVADSYKVKFRNSAKYRWICSCGSFSCGELRCCHLLRYVARLGDALVDQEWYDTVRPTESLSSAPSGPCMPVPHAEYSESMRTGCNAKSSRMSGRNF